MFWPFRRKTSLLESGLLKGCTDAHSHILFGVDDGIKSKEAALEALALMEEFGVEKLWLTPHIMEDVPNDSACLRARFDELSSSYDGKIQLSLAAEYMLDNLFIKRLEDKDILPIGGDMILVETSQWLAPCNFREVLSKIMSAGYYPLLAHPERYSYMNISDYESLSQKGVRFQLNLPSLAGCYGKQVKGKAEYLLSKGLYFTVGSDCHRTNLTHHYYKQPTLSESVIKSLTGLLNKKI